MEVVIVMIMTSCFKHVSKFLLTKTQIMKLYVFRSQSDNCVFCEDIIKVKVIATSIKEALSFIGGTGWDECEFTHTEPLPKLIIGTIL